MHAAHPLIAVWDDHEIANDCWRGGAQNHGDGEGRWGRRRDAALQADAQGFSESFTMATCCR